MLWVIGAPECVHVGTYSTSPVSLSSRSFLGRLPLRCLSLSGRRSRGRHGRGQEGVGLYRCVGVRNRFGEYAAPATRGGRCGSGWGRVG